GNRAGRPDGRLVQPWVDASLGPSHCRPGSAIRRSTSLRAASLRAASRPGHAIASDVFVALFTFQTAHLVPAARVCTPGLRPSLSAAAALLAQTLYVVNRYIQNVADE